MSRSNYPLDPFASRHRIQARSSEIIAYSANFLHSPVPSISTVTTPSGKLGKGDVVVSIPKDLAVRVQDYIAKESGCKNYKKTKRAIGADCLQSSAEGLLMNAVPGGAFDGLFFAQGVAFQIGGIARREYVQALLNVQQFAAGLAGQLNIDNKKAATLGALAFALVYKVYIDGQSLTEQNVFAANEIGTGTITSGPTSTASGCPSDAPKTNGPNPLCCQNNNCKGDKKAKLCGTVCLTVAEVDHLLTLWW